MTKIEEGLKKHIYELEQELESTHKIVAKQSADITVYEEIVDDLEAKLAEKDKEIEELKQSKLVEDFGDAVLNFAIGNKSKLDLWHLIEQHAEKEMILEERIRELKQDKISFAVERLEKVKNKFNGKRPIDDLANEVGLELGYTATQIQKYIDNQIEELKKEMK